MIAFVRKDDKPPDHIYSESNNKARNKKKRAAYIARKGKATYVGEGINPKVVAGCGLPMVPEVAAGRGSPEGGP